jgi:glucosamine-6-phosphate deaminase
MGGLITHFKVDKLDVFVFETRKQMGRAAYELYCEEVNYILESQAKIRAIFAAAHSQDDFFACLAADRSIDFSRMEAFHMDEYVNLGKEAPQNFGNFLTNAIFSKKNFGTVHLIDSEPADVEAECRRYETLLKAAPPDIVSLGFGENGHIAFNDPGEAKFDDPAWVRITALDDFSRQQQVNDGEFATIDDVPKHALTLTIPALMSCRTIIGIVPLDRKAEAVRNALYGPISEMCPASILRTHDNAVLFIDKGAAAKINI